MTFHELVLTRISQRGYDPDRPVPKKMLSDILETAHLAPSAVNKQPWEFLVIQSQEMLDRVHAAYPRDWFMKAPCIVVVKGFRDRAWVRAYDNYNYLETDLAIAMDHLTLAATEQGLGTCWIGNYEPTVLRSALNLQENEEVFAMTPLGFAPAGYAPKFPKTRQELSAVVRYL